MSDLWERFKRWHCGQDRIDERSRDFERRMEWHREDIERARKIARAELRDRFAMAALTGMMANDLGVYAGYADVAASAWRIADAMLKARGDE